jgi:hypothetical protein
MSLDGFVAGRDHEMDWIFEHAARRHPSTI